MMAADHLKPAENAEAAGPAGVIAPRTGDASPAVPAPPNTTSAHHRGSPRRLLIGVTAAIVLIVILVGGVPWIITTIQTVSTDDAYVNGHVTFVAARVPGQVMHVFVDDNNRVHKGDLLVQLDKEPYRVQVQIAQSGVDVAQSDLVAAQAQTRGLEGQARSLRFSLEHAIEDVDNQVALLRSKVATLNVQKAINAKSQDDYDRALPLVQTGGVSREELDRRKEALEVAQAQVEEALQDVYQIRVQLGLPPKSDHGDDLSQVPDDLDQTFSGVRQAQFTLVQAAAQLGVFDSMTLTPKEMIANFYKRDPHGNVNNIYEGLLKTAPGIKQVEAKLDAANANLSQAELNLRYCDVVAEIDGVVTRRDVNPGNNVVAGQALMAVRSVTEIWVDANFKETQLEKLRIGQSADLDVDMYGGRRRFKGRVTGFTMGTGSTLSLLPPENATGNFVKVVQRLPVRIDLIDYDPETAPLFIGLSVTPYVHINEEPSGPDAGKILQPALALPTAPTEPMPGTATQPATQP